MFIDRLEVHNNTMIKITEHITHTPHTCIYSHIYFIFILLSYFVSSQTVFSVLGGSVRVFETRDDFHNIAI